MFTLPEVPELEVPELNVNKPLTPSVPWIAERMSMAPLEVDPPSPLVKVTAPPVRTVLSPALTSTPPPEMLSVTLPTANLTCPPFPLIALPDPIDTEPVLPEEEVPELNTSSPLTPLVPEFDVVIVIAPLVVDVP
jgi:hypothetical protein